MEVVDCGLWIVETRLNTVLAMLDMEFAILGKAFIKSDSNGQFVTEQGATSLTPH